MLLVQHWQLTDIPHLFQKTNGGVGTCCRYNLVQVPLKIRLVRTPLCRRGFGAVSDAGGVEIETCACHGTFWVYTEKLNKYTSVTESKK